MKQFIACLVAALAAADDLSNLYGEGMEFLDGHRCTVPKVGQHYGYESTGQRGQVRKPRRQAATPQPLMQTDRDGTIDETDKHVGRSYDWREYEPELYGGLDPVADCPEIRYIKHLDTPEYQALPAICKEDVIWQRALSDGTKQRFFTGGEFGTFFQSDMNVSFDTCSDTMPEGRKKVTHPVGLMAKMEFVAHPDTPYTGSFKGTQHVIMRISDTTMSDPLVGKTAPGHGIKLLRDGMASANWFAMFNLDGQDSFNFFKNRWTTSPREPLNECARDTIAKHVASVTDHVGFLSLMEIAQFDQYGNYVEEPNWPFQIDVEPYDVYGWTDEYQNDFQDQLGSIPYGTVLFKVMAFDMPPELGGEEQLIGALVMRSNLITSFFGDTELYFQHHRMEDDIKVRPHYFEWLQFWDNGKFHETPLPEVAPMVKCPFFFLFEAANLV